VSAKHGVLVCGLLGLIGFFLPAFAGDGDSSLWAARSSPDAQQVWLVLIAFAGAAAMGVLGIRSGMERWKAFAAIVCFAFVLVKFRSGISGHATPFELFSYALGLKLVAVGAIGGLILAILAAARPEDAAATS
jgi:hypothetical protein